MNKINYTVGILGAGQLARMLFNAAPPLGLEVICQDPAEEISARNHHPCLRAEYDNISAIDQLLIQSDYITFENENIPIATAEYIHQRKKLFPPPKSLYYSQDRLIEKQFIQSHHIPTAPFHPINHVKDLKQAAEILGFPLLLKTRRFGYDGKGQYRVNNIDEGQKILETLTQHSEKDLCLIAEGIVSFQQELSIIAARNKSETAFYPLVENHHHHGILRLSRSPVELDPTLQQQAENIATKLLTTLNYEGVLSIELFKVNNELIVNEIAPRVHNSGHWTIEGSHTSQFENHLRAICNLPLGKTEARGYSIMLNIIGDFPELSTLLNIPFCHVHDYQKSPRPLRKLGHITLNHQDPEFLEHLLKTNKTIQHLLRDTSLCQNF